MTQPTSKDRRGSESAADFASQKTHEAAPPRILAEHRNCWRIARANRFAAIVDAGPYFAAAKNAILQARRSVILIGWDFDLRIGLERDEPIQGAPNDLQSFLRHVVASNPELHIYVLRWDMSALRYPFRATLPLKLLDWLAGGRLEFNLDHAHPVGACHHQKIVVIDDVLAFCGGIDITDGRWDTRDHLDKDERRADPDGSHYGPWHDVTACLDGEAARALGELARERWRRATGKRIPPAPPRDPVWPEHLEPLMTDVDVAIARTDPAYGEVRQSVQEIEALYLDAIAAAKDAIYIETQYFASHKIAAAMIERLQESTPPEIIVINPKSAAGWLEEAAMGAARAALLQDVRAADHLGRFQIYTPVTEGGDDIYVHSKTLIVDDRLVRIGSSNINNRSLGLDTECDLAIEADGTDASSEVRSAASELRDTLLCEHLGAERETLRAAVAECGLLGAIERLRVRRGRTLAPFDPPEFSAAEIELARSGLLDPSKPEEISRTLRRGVFSSVKGLWRPVEMATDAFGSLAKRIHALTGARG